MTLREGGRGHSWEATGNLHTAPRPGWSWHRSDSPEHEAVMEAFSANQKTAVSVRDSVGDEDDALGKAKAESVNVCFFYCGFIGHNQVLLKIADEHFLFPYPSYSPDIREGFTGDLEEKQNKAKKEESKKERVKVRNFSLEKRSVLFHKCRVLTSYIN